ncbi:YefM protein (antitoxin to YoeB), partial [uncultured Microcoleus sp.]
MQCYYLNLTPHLFRKHCIFSQCRGCGNQFGKEWQRRSRIAIALWSG